jgi:gamma-glutamylcyclotransferase (GGCT)/AIG2-like uncharacterized protein YtfP
VPTRGTDAAWPPATGPAPRLVVFLYGSLLDPVVLARKSGRRGLLRRAVPAVLPGWRRVLLRAAPYPTVLPARRHRVGGSLIRIGGAPLRRLMAYEGAAYRLRCLRVLTPRGPQSAFAWVAKATLAVPSPRTLARAQS